MKGEGADGETKRLRRRKRKNKMFTSLFLPTSLVREESGEIDVVLIQTKDGSAVTNPDLLNWRQQAVRSESKEK